MSQPEHPPGRQPVLLLPAPRIDRRFVWQALVVLVTGVAILIGLFVVLALIRGVVLIAEEAPATAADWVGLVLAFNGLVLGNVFLLYSLKYYVSSIAALLAIA